MLKSEKSAVERFGGVVESGILALLRGGKYVEVFIPAPTQLRNYAPIHPPHSCPLWLQTILTSPPLHPH